MRQMYFILVALLVAQFPASAKDELENATTGIVTGGGSFPHFTPQANGSGMGAILSYRMIGRTNAKFNGAVFLPADSTDYAYSNGRGGGVNVDNPSNDEATLFDESYTYIYNTSINAYDNRLFRKQTFDAANQITSLTYSSWHAITSAWKDSARYLYTYIPGTNKMDVSSLEIASGGTMWVQHDKSELSYNGNNVVAVSSGSYNATFTYDANNNITSIEDKVYDHATGTLNNNQHKAYVYNGNNEVTSFTLQQWNKIAGAWENTKYWEYAYVNGRVINSFEYNWNGSTWRVAAKHIYDYMPNGDKKTEIVQLWDAASSSFVNNTSEEWVYNSNNLVTSITISSWNSSLNSWQYTAGNTQMRFYYEYYSPTAVQKIGAEAGDMKVYPVPAVTSVHIDLRWKNAQPFHIGVYGMTGQQIISRDEATALSYSGDINISYLPSGTYFLRANSAEGELVRQIEISK